FQDIKGGLDAELVRDRGFDEQSYGSDYRDTGSVIRMTETMMPLCAWLGMLTFILRSMGIRIRWPASTLFVWMCRANSNSGEAFIKVGFRFGQESTMKDI